MHETGMHNFPPMDRVIFGQPAAQTVLAEAERLGAKRVLLVVSHTLNTTTDEIEKIKVALGSRHASTTGNIPQHTSRKSAMEVTRAALDITADLIVAIGGGSVVDVVKIATVCMEMGITEEDGLDGYELMPGTPTGAAGKVFRSPTVRSVMVPSTLSGGEYNAGALVTDTRRNWKQIFHTPHMMPASIVLDPELTRHTPEALWLGSGMRSMDHGIEALCSPVGTPLADAVILKGISDLAVALPRSKENPDDMEARRLCQQGSWLSAFGLQCRILMGASHAIGHALGGTMGVPHYLIAPVLLPSVLRYNKPVTGEAQAAIAKALGAEGEDASDALYALVSRLGLPKSLDEVGVDPSDYERIGEVAIKSIFARSNPRPLTTAPEVVDLLQIRRGN